MRVLLKTIGWMILSGLIIFISNLTAGVDWRAALVGAAVAKIGTTIAYLVYEVTFERAWQRPQPTKQPIHDKIVNVTYYSCVGSKTAGHN